MGVLAAAILCGDHHDGVHVANAFSVASSTISSRSRRRTTASSSSSLGVSSAVDYETSTHDSIAEMMGGMTLTSVVRSKAPIAEKKTTASNKKKKQKKTKSSSSSSTSTTIQTTTKSSSVKPAEDNNMYTTTAPYLSEEEVMRRKLEWAGRYTSVEALREHFGTNQNKLWGDLQASTARRLYKTLLPRALVELSQLGVGQLQPQELAPLAYQARVAAKLYARERCTVPARIGATVFDGFRQWIKYGKFQAHGMTYDQLWQKYAEKIIHETENPEQDICLKIIERSCISNEGVDSLVLSGSNSNSNSRKKKERSVSSQQQKLVEQIHAQLEQDMYQLLLPNVEVCSGEGDTTSSSSSSSSRKVCKRRKPWDQRNHVLIVRLLAKQRRILQLKHQQQQKEMAKELKEAAAASAHQQLKP